MQLMLPRLLEQVSDASNYMFVWLLVKKHIMYIVRGVVVIMLPHTADSEPLSVKTEPHPQSREYIKKKDGMMCAVMTHSAVLLILVCTSLDKLTLKYLMKELHPKVSDKWDDIGIELEVDDKLLVQIKKDYPGNSKQCLKEVLREWLRTSNPPPSWEAIAQVVADVGDEELAAELRSKCCN